MIPISVCIIAKNEEKNIEKCLSSIATYGFEIVVVDTGSTDKTMELARKYTDKVYDFTWINDFSAARNFSLEMASNKWIFMLDCDEWIESIDIEEMNYFRKKYPHAVGSVNRNNITGTPENPGPISIDRTERLYSKSAFHYTGIIHEQLTPKHASSFENFLLNTTIGHSGYCMTETEREKKAKRNIDLLQLQLSQNSSNPYIYYQLGKGYQMINDLEKAYLYLGKGLEFDVDPELAYVKSMVIEYGYAMLELGKYVEALSFQNIYDSFSDSADFVYLMGLIYLHNQLYENALDEFIKATTFEFSNKEGTNTYLSFYQIAKILIMANEIPTAISYLKKCNSYEPAQELLLQLSQL